MNMNILDVVCCPVCKGSLSVKEDTEELFCHKCSIPYPVEDRIFVLERADTPEILFCQKCGKNVEVCETPWISLGQFKGGIFTCSECHLIIRKCTIDELNFAKKDRMFKKQIEKDFDHSAFVYEKFRFPFASAMLGINPLRAIDMCIRTPVARLDVKKGTILDVATGTGLAARELSKKVGLSGHVFGVDISLVMLKKGKEKAAQEGLTNMTFVKGDADELPFKGETVDGVTCLNSFISERFLTEMSRVLKRGSPLVITVGGNVDNPNFLMKMTLRISRRYGTLFFTENEITDILEGLNFKDIHVQWSGLLMVIDARKG